MSRVSLILLVFFAGQSLAAAPVQQQSLPGAKVKPQPSTAPSMTAPAAKSVSPVPRTPTSRAVGTAVPLSEKRCEIKGGISNVPDYLHVRVNLTSHHPYTVEGGVNVPSPSARYEYRFANLQCAHPPERTKNYSLKYKYSRDVCDERFPSRTDSVQAFDTVVISNLTTSNPQFTEVTRDFHTLTTSGILIRDMTTDRPSYEFGDIIHFSFRAFIKGATLPGVTRRDRANYVVTVESGGISHEVGSGVLDVRLGSEEVVSIPIHHVNYSRGSNVIKVSLSDLGFDCSKSIRREID